MSLNSKKEGIRLKRKTETCMIRDGDALICIDPSLPIFHILGKKYTLLIITYLDSEKFGKSFNDILMGIPGSSSTIISSRLKELEAEGLITKNDVNGRIKYNLTRKGLLIKESVLPLIRTIEKKATLFQ